MQAPDSPQTRARPGGLARSAFLWGLAGGLVDTTLFLLLGIDCQMAGRDVTPPVALYLGLNFAPPRLRRRRRESSRAAAPGLISGERGSSPSHARRDR
jgi:hypothetical protein